MITFNGLSKDELNLIKRYRLVNDFSKGRIEQLVEELYNKSLESINKSLDGKVIAFKSKIDTNC